MKKSLVRTIIFGSVVGAVFIGAFVCYGISNNYKAQFKDKNLEATNNMNKRNEIERIDPVQAKEYDDKLTLNLKDMDAYSYNYRVFAVSAYCLTIGGLAAFGICLGISDKIKQKEEDAAGRD